MTEKKSMMGEYVDMLKNTQRHVFTGVSFMVPCIVAGAMLLAFSLLAFQYGLPETGFFGDVIQVGLAGMTLFIPVLAAYISFSMVDRPGIVPALIGGYLASTLGLGFIGGLIAAFIAGSSVFFLKKVPVPEEYAVAQVLLLIPIVGTLITGIAIIYFSVPVNALLGSLTSWLHGLMPGSRMAACVIIGVLSSIDLGGPINVTVALFAQDVYLKGISWPLAAATVTWGLTSLIPPLAYIIDRRMPKKRLRKTDRAAAMGAFILHTMSIGEGGYPFLFSYPKAYFPAIAIGGGVAGALTAYFGLEQTVWLGGWIGSVGANNPILFVLTMTIGSLVGALIFLALLKPIEEKGE